MLECFTDGIEVHDAIYSKMLVNTKIIQQTVFERIGYAILIDK